MKKIFTLFAVVLIGLAANAQSFYDLNTIQTIDITFAQSNWDALLDAEKAGNENYIMAQTVVINGTTFDSVGVKYKGNSTYNANQTKNPFHIELDTYKDQDYQGYTDIKLSNVAKDPSFLREVLSYYILRQYMHASQSNYANVTVNGNLIGLYSNSEAVNKSFVNRKFFSKKNTFIKCNPIAGAGPQSNDLPNLVYLGQDSTDYYPAYELKSDDGWQELINLCDTLKNNTAAIETILDVDRAIWMLAYDNALVNLDSYIGGFAQNYYLYRDQNGRYNSVVWDLNESFGGFARTGTGNLNSNAAKQQMSPLLNINDADYPLVQELLAIPMYKRMYLAHLKTIMLENFDNNSYFTQGQALQNVISSAVQADPNKFYTFNNFTDNLTTDVTTGGPGPGGGGFIGITNLMNARSSYILGLPDFTATEPTITNVNPSNTSPNLNSVVTINASVANANTVYLGSRSDIEDRFTRVLMYDDGAHNDGAANDGVYGADLTVSNIAIQYYIYAENNTIGKFSPVRAEHEYHTLSVVVPPAGDVVINEIQASNSATVADQDGEYDDWIELYNNTTSAINLENYYLSDKVDNLTKWKFPAGTSIPANGYLIIWADEDTAQTGIHANFKLSSAGETLFLVDANTVILDQMTFSNLSTDMTYGRYPNGTGAFADMGPTHNAMNSNSVGVINVVKENIEIKAYPNPATAVCHLQVSAEKNKTRNVNVYDLYGKKIYSNTIDTELSIPTAQWSAGTYLIRVDDTALKIMVQ